jgi:HEAT repeat protein
VQQALAQRLFQGQAPLQLDEAALAVVQQSLASPHVGVVLYALDTLAHSHPETMVKALPDLLAHPVPEVRLEALHRIEAMRLKEAITVVRQHIPREQSPDVCAVALRTLATLDETSVVDEIEPFLTHKYAQIQQGALVGLLQNAGTAVRNQAKHRLMTFAASTKVADRVLAAQTICEVRSPDLQPLLEPLLTDESLIVKRNALTAAAHYPDLWPTLLAALTDPETRAVAAATLAVAGEAAVPTLQTAFNAEQDREVLWHLARILGNIGTPPSHCLLERASQPSCS